MLFRQLKEFRDKTLQANTPDFPQKSSKWDEKIKKQGQTEPGLEKTKTVETSLHSFPSGVVPLTGFTCEYNRGHEESYRLSSCYLVLIQFHLNTMASHK